MASGPESNRRWDLREGRPMRVTCSRCSRVLEYGGEAPVFCAYCGRRLGDGGLNVTATFVSDPTTGVQTPPAQGSQSETAAGGPGSADRVPERIGGFQLLRLLGRGGMGSVYEAEDSGSGRRVALKLIAADSVASPEAVERFRQEGRLACTIAHPRCVFVLSADEEEGRPYIVMELMPGETLQSLVQQAGPLPPREAIGKILDVIDGLIEAHHVGIIHRDVKPSNCFVDSGGRVKIGDFGLSKALGGDVHLTRTGAFVGTPLYASPEQIKCEPTDERTDVYSTAATLYYLLAGRPPFQESEATATLARIVSEPTPSLRSLGLGLPAALDLAVLRGLERDRERRWRTLAEFRAVLVPFGPRRRSSTRQRVHDVLEAVLTLAPTRLRLAGTGRRRAPRSRRLPSRPSLYGAAITRPAGVLREIGPFRVLGPVRWGTEQRVLLGEDSTLDRPVWILLRPRGAPPPAPARVGLDRPGRPRWLNGGDQAEGRWDAYVAPQGCSLADLAGPEGLPWRDARPILLDLAEELAAACGDGTLPPSLAVDQVWIQPDGSAQLVDILAPSSSTATIPDQPPQGTGQDQERALGLLFQAAAISLEGGRRRKYRNTDHAPIHAAIPQHTARLLDRLRGAGPPCQDVSAFLGELSADEGQPTEVDAGTHLAHLGLQAVVLSPGLATMFLAALPSRAPTWLDFPIIVAWPLVWLIWAAMTRGGWLLRPAGIAVARFDSRAAERWRCGVRAAMAWLPATAFLLGSAWIRHNGLGPVWLGWVNWGTALIAILSAIPLAVASPARLPHDRLSGSWLVPR
jgi:serine/threonine protein kinase